MNTAFDRSKNNYTAEWYTPPEIINSVGVFDLDPCTSKEAILINDSAKNFYTKADNGLLKDWYGRVWLNPPYDNIAPFMAKLAKHGNGVAPVYNRSDTVWFHDYVLRSAGGIFYFQGRVKFYNQFGEMKGTPGAPSVLVAYGEYNIHRLSLCGLKGIFKRL